MGKHPRNRLLMELLKVHVSKGDKVEKEPGDGQFWLKLLVLAFD